QKCHWEPSSENGLCPGTSPNQSKKAPGMLAPPLQTDRIPKSLTATATWCIPPGIGVYSASKASISHESLADNLLSLGFRNHPNTAGRGTARRKSHGWLLGPRGCFGCFAGI